MAPSRRGFLKLAAGAGLVPKRMPESLGQVVFCRVSHNSRPEAIDWLQSVFDGALPVSVSGSTLRYRDFVAAYRQSREEELVICGSEATLVLNRRGSQRFA